MKQLVLRLIMCGAIFAVMMTACSSPTPTHAPKPKTVIETKLTADERAAIFDTAWQTVNDGYFDPTFGGKTGKPSASSTAKSSRRFRTTHLLAQGAEPDAVRAGCVALAALPSEFANQIDPMTFATGKLGIDVRLLDGVAVITEVAPGLTAEQAGLRPGWVITSVDGWTLEDIAAAGLQTPPTTNATGGATRCRVCAACCTEKPGNRSSSSISIGTTDRSALPCSLAKRNSTCAQFDPSLPPACTEFEVKRLA